MIILVVLVPIAVAALFVARSQSRPNVSDAGWSTPEVAATVTDPLTRQRASTMETVRGIGRIEGRLLLESVWMAIGLGFCALIVLMFTVLFVDDTVGTWMDFAQLSPWFVHPLVGMTVLASHRATTRSVRDGAEEVFGVCPTRPEARTVGHLAAAWLPVLASVLFLVGFGLLLWLRSPFIHGTFTEESAGDLAATILLCVGGVALGVALGRWIRFALAPV